MKDIPALETRKAAFAAGIDKRKFGKNFERITTAQAPEFLGHNPLASQEYDPKDVIEKGILGEIVPGMKCPFAWLLQTNSDDVQEAS